MAERTGTDRIGSGDPGLSTFASSIVRLLGRGKLLRLLPVWSRYLITIIIILFFFAVRYALGTAYPYPYLPFVLGVILVSFILDRGSGFLATGFSAILAVYFFVEPRYTFQLLDIGPVTSVILFVLVGVLAASIIEALRIAVEELAVTAADLANSRRELAENFGILETVIESTPDPIFVKDLESRYRRVNAAGARMIGAPASVMLGKRALDFLPRAEAEKLEATDRVVLSTRTPITVEEQISVAGVGPRWFLTTKAPWYGPDGTLAGIVKTARDIHERKLAEDEVREANATKELLLHDINHRIKNHLQSVISTLRISRRQINDPEAQNAMETAIGRLSVLGRVYDRLELKPGGEAVVSARDFISGLCDDLKPTLVGLRPISVEVRVQHIPLELDRAVPVGLIVNEALSNALKHAFPEDAAGHVTVVIEEREGHCYLEVTDDGLGATDEQIGSGTGTKLIRAFAQQLRGTAEWRGPPGTSVVVRFPC